MSSDSFKTIVWRLQGVTPPLRTQKGAFYHVPSPSWNCYRRIPIIVKRRISNNGGGYPSSAFHDWTSNSNSPGDRIPAWSWNKRQRHLAKQLVKTSRQVVCLCMRRVITGRKELRICFCFGSLVRQVMWRLRIALPWKHSTAAEMQSANCQFCCSQLFP